SEVWDRVTPTRIIMAAIQIILRSRWEDGVSSVEMLPGSVSSLSRQDLLTMIEASLGDVSSASKAQSEELFSLLNLVVLLSALIKEESISDESTKSLLHAAERVCLESLQDDVLRRGIECGPWDVSESSAPTLGLVDMGGIRVPASVGMEVRRMEVDGDTVAVTLMKDGTAIQLQAFLATPETSWNIIRVDMTNKMRTQGGVVKEWGGRAGLEIRAVVPVVTESGQSAVRDVRILGCDGPGWMLRGVVSGTGAKPESRDEWPYEIFLGTVVVGTHPVCTQGGVTSLRLQI
ncbi:DUF3710 domain-containing protein, partial [Streptomyces sp. NPDC057565]|uniref:DUF3710 domain-containing protein n=1 Tax=Streptomyces sp. NPDC057565 TaxID=3346169 RepID=UPI0036C9EF8B